MAKDVLKVKTAQVVKLEKAATLSGIKIIQAIKYGEISAVEVDFKKPSQLFELRENMDLMDDAPIQKTEKEGK